MADVHEALLHEVQQSAGRGHKDIDAAVQGADLGRLADAAVNDRRAQADVAAVDTKALADLHGELRVGATIRARTLRPRPFTCRPARPSRCKVGKAKAAVLPVPVWAQPTASRPSRIGGIAAA